MSVFSPVYGAAEGVIGVASQAETPGYIVSPRAAHVEFLPIEEAPTAASRPLPLEAVEIGQTYEIVCVDMP